MRTIEFNDEQLFDTDPVYTFDGNTVSLQGEVSLDAEFPDDMVVKGYTTNGIAGYTPVTASFGIPVREVDATLNGAPTGSIVVGYDARGNILFAEQLAEGMTRTVVSFESETNGIARIEIWDDVQTMVDNIDPASLLDGAADVVAGLLDAATGGGLLGGDDPFLVVDLAEILPIAVSDAAVSLSYPAGVGGGIGLPAFDRITFDRDFDAYVEGDGTLTGTDGEDLIEGGDDDGSISGGEGNDVMRGGAGNDTLDGGAGGDFIDGGDGTDTVDYSGSADGVAVDLGDGTGSGGTAEGDTVVGVENIQGSDQDDVLTGSDAANILRSGAGDDILSAGAGDDTVIGNDGNDILEGGAGADTLDGSDGTDWVSYASSDAGVMIDLNVGTAAGGHAEGDILTSIERVAGSAHDDALTGSDARDFMRGEGGDDTLSGGVGIDRLDGGTGADILDGGAEADWALYTESSEGVVVSLTTGETSGGDATGDTLISIENLQGSDHADTLTGDAGTNILFGRSGADILSAGGGADMLVGGAGADTIDGGGGFDWASYDRSGEAVTMDFATGIHTGGDAAGDVLINIEAIRGSDHDDRFVGDASANHFEGGNGDDTLIGGAGNDTLDGGAGADTFDGGIGQDWVTYVNSASAVTVDLAANTASGGDAEGDTFAEIERIMGSRFADEISGSAEKDTLAGAGGDDILRGNGGADRLEGGAGADFLDGGASLSDTALYTNSAAAVHVNLEAGTATGGEAAGDTLVAIERLSGSAFDDTLTGDAGDNVLRGSVGDDTLNGGDGEDALHGEDGADTMNGGAGIDTVNYFRSDAAVVIDLAAGTASGGHATGDQLLNIEDIQGSNFADVLVGDAEANFLHGNGGDDVLTGGAGRDILDGGAGADTFVFGTDDDNDRIQDFEAGTDLIQIIGGGFGDLLIDDHELGASVKYGTTSIVVLDVAATDLGAEDFIFA